MTIYAWLYLIPGIASFVWPIMMLLVKKHVNDVQWLFSFSQVVIGLAILLYSSYFNTNIRGEYFLNLLYCSFAVLAPAVYYLFVNKLTNPDGVTLKERMVFLSPIMFIVVMISSALVAGREYYRLYLDRAVYGGDASLLSASSYNQLVVINYYVFLIFLVSSITVITILSFFKFIKYFKLLDEYMAANGKKRLFALNVRVIFVISTTIILLALILGTHPLYDIQSVPLVMIISIVMTLLQLILGFVVWNVGVTAEDISKMKSLEDHRHGRMQWLGPQELLDHYKELDEKVVSLVEEQQLYLDPRFGLDMLSDRLEVSSVEIVDMLHVMHGCSFAEYVNGLRIDRAVTLILLKSENDDAVMLKYKVNKTDFLDEIAAECGYDSKDLFLKTFNIIMGMSLMDWLNEGIA